MVVSQDSHKDETKELELRETVRSIAATDNAHHAAGSIE
jgi:hypothetical protein